MAATLAFLVSSAAADDHNFSLNFNGANGVDQPLRFTPRDVSEAFPNLQLEEFEGDNSFGGGPRMMALLNGDVTVFVVDLAEAETVYSFSIFTRSKTVVGPQGWRVGETVLAEVVDQDGWDCGRGYNEQAYRVSCINWEESLRLLFEEQPDISTETVGPETYEAVLGDAVLEEMRQYLNRPIQ